ncbi:hypothetical protein VP01_1294g5 [Puccinia sorghi]|uniref:Uncharacterized protein n=1 Tax=Puccinia sorghi TaxID=27349 RepID=A0A0L6VNC1_9BASI|nr:hypothetical protein VP01_1294g5 [Puccinia sorghi]
MEQKGIVKCIQVADCSRIPQKLNSAVKGALCCCLGHHFPHVRNFNNSLVESGHTFIKIFISNSSMHFFRLPQNISSTQYSKHRINSRSWTRKIQLCLAFILSKKDIDLESEDFHPQWQLDYNLECTVSSF